MFANISNGVNLDPSLKVLTSVYVIICFQALIGHVSLDS